MRGGFKFRASVAKSEVSGARLLLASVTLFFRDEIAEDGALFVGVHLFSIIVLQLF